MFSFSKLNLAHTTADEVACQGSLKRIYYVTIVRTTNMEMGHDSYDSGAIMCFGLELLP